MRKVATCVGLVIAFGLCSYGVAAMKPVPSTAGATAGPHGVAVAGAKEATVPGPSGGTQNVVQVDVAAFVDPTYTSHCRETPSLLIVWGVGRTGSPVPPVLGGAGSFATFAPGASQHYAVAFNPADPNGDGTMDFPGALLPGDVVTIEATISDPCKPPIILVRELASYIVK